MENLNKHGNRAQRSGLRPALSLQKTNAEVTALTGGTVQAVAGAIDRNSTPMPRTASHAHLLANRVRSSGTPYDLKLKNPGGDEISDVPDSSSWLILYCSVQVVAE